MLLKVQLSRRCGAIAEPARSLTIGTHYVNTAGRAPCTVQSREQFRATHVRAATITRNAVSAQGANGKSVNNLQA